MKEEKILGKKFTKKMFIDRSSIYKNNFIKDNEEIKYNTKKILEIKRKNYINLNENVYYEILRKKYE